LRLAGIVCALLTNLVVARQLTLAQIAYYYLYATLAYFGNAGLYVGLGVVLQRLCANLASSGKMNKRLFFRYMAASVAGGTGAVILFAGVYLSARGAQPDPWYGAAWCAALSGANYVSLVGKDLLALSRSLGLAALFGLIEQAFRLSLVALVVTLPHAGAIEVTAAMALGSILAGVGAITVLIVRAGSIRDSSAPAPILKDIGRTVTPIGFSGLLNWLQLQAYRPVLLYFGAGAELIGITALLTSLGMTGANPVFTVTAQTYIPRLYAGDLGAFRTCLRALGRWALALAAASIPAALAFLFLSDRRALLPYLLLVPLGVFVDAGNNFIGTFVHRQNATKGSMWIFPVSSAMGVVVVAASWLLPVPQRLLPYLIAVAMVVSQLLVIGTIYAFGNRNAKLPPTAAGTYGPR